MTVVTPKDKKTPTQLMEDFDDRLDQALRLASLEPLPVTSSDECYQYLLQAHNVYKKFFQVEDRSNDNLILQARCLVRLIDAYGTFGQISLARQLLAEMAKLPMLPEIKLETGRAALNLAADYASLGDILEAKSLLNSVGRASHDEALALERARVILIIAAKQARNVSAEVAKATYATLKLTEELVIELKPFILNYVIALIDSFKAPVKKSELLELEKMVNILTTDSPSTDPDENFLRFQARLSLSEKMGEIRRLKLALTLFQAEPSDDLQTLTIKSRAAAALVVQLAEARQLFEAYELYERTSSLGDDPEILLNRIKAAKALIEAYFPNNLHNLAYKTYNDIISWPHAAIVVPARAWLAIPFVESLAPTERWPEALKMYKEVASHLGSQDFPLEQHPSKGLKNSTAQLIVALSWLAVHYLQGLFDQNKLELIPSFYKGLESLGSSRTAIEGRAMAASLLIANHAVSNRADEALRIFQTLPPAGSSEAIKAVRQLSSKILYKSLSKKKKNKTYKKHKRSSNEAARWKSIIAVWLDEQLKDFKKAQGSHLPTKW
ncbi:MAG: hypothetical protein LBT38_10840 [Deltaproteobacteria bacterium]|jgi:hypothetical protein|nr:hypothetical protein [Deltaproteobacteria bacterium]